MSKKFTRIYVEITNYCNLSCSFCSKDTRDKREMTVDEFRDVISKIKDYTENIYLHVKGEPLLHSNFDKILSVCDENNVNLKITTNGTMLTKRKDVLLKHNIKQISISLHSENNIPTYFEDVFNASDELSKKMTIVYRIWTLPTLDLDKFSTTIVDKIIKHYKLDNSVIDKIKHEKATKLANNIYLDKNYEFKWPKISCEKSVTGTCLGTKDHIAILSNGNVTACCLDSEGIIKLGNIFESSLLDIINGDLFKEINTGFNNNKIVHDLCKSCTYRLRFSEKKINDK